MNNRQTRTNEGGSVVSFIVIGVILAAFVVGGIYIVQKRGENTTPVASPAATTSSKSPVVTDSMPPSVTPGKTTPSPTASPHSSTGTPLPKTGPSDDIVSAIALAILVGIVIAYLRSYKFRFGSLTS